MHGGLFGLKQSQKLFILLSLLFPSILIASLLYRTNNALLTAIIYQLICCILVPLIYIKKLSKEKEVRAYFFNEFQNRSEQVKEGAQYFAGAFSIIFVIFVLQYEFRMTALKMIKLPMEHNTIYLSGIILIMGLLNPILDEWLWRVFFPKTLPNKTPYLLFIHFCYALYHSVILFYCQGYLSAIISLSTYFSLSNSLYYLRQKYGFITPVICHYGINVAFIIIVSDISYSIQKNPFLIFPK